MKKTLFLFAFTLISTFSFAQVKKEDEAPKSKLELFSDRSGTMIKKEYLDIQKIAGVKFQILKTTDLANNLSVSGLRIEGTGSGTYATTRIAFLDVDEIDGLIKALDYMNTTVLSVTPPQTDVEYHFTSRSGFEAGVYNYRGKWYTFLRLEKYASDSKFGFSIEELAQVKSAVVEVKSKI